VELLLAVPTMESMEKPIFGFGGLTVTGGEEELAVTVVVVMGDDLLLAFCWSSIMPANCWLRLLLFRPLKCIK
jgi:hypothetical protein